MPTLFTKIINGDIPGDIVYQDDEVTAFRDIHPQGPTHILIVPNKHMASVNEASPEDRQAEVGDGLVRCADELHRAGKLNEAVTLYRDLSQPTRPAAQRHRLQEGARHPRRRDRDRRRLDPGGRDRRRACRRRSRS